VVVFVVGIVCCAIANGGVAIDESDVTLVVVCVVLLMLSWMLLPMLIVLVSLS
jgi:hypothetical protein